MNPLEIAAMPREPRLTMVDTMVGADGEPLSLITRIWPRRATSKCTLCPSCSARPMLLASLCTVATPRFIGRGVAATHRLDVERGDKVEWSNGGETSWAELVEGEA